MCTDTYSTLRIFSDEFDPEQITKVLGIEPTRTFRKGEPHAQGRLRRKANGWFFTTEGRSDSKDTRVHIDLILAALEGRAPAVAHLHELGCEIDMTSYWVFDGQGGPWLIPQQMLALGTLGIDVWWDVYFDDETAASKHQPISPP